MTIAYLPLFSVIIGRMLNTVFQEINKFSYLILFLNLLLKHLQDLSCNPLAPEAMFCDFFEGRNSFLPSNLFLILGSDFTIL